MRVRLRNYSQDQRRFLSKFVTTLVQCKMAYFNPTSSWACAPLLVPKPGAAQFRFTVDLRLVNRFTVKHQFPMPNLEQELTRLGGARYFARWDLSHCYWQLPLDKTSQECQSFITPDGIFSPTRVLHGTTNAVLFLQSTLAACLPQNLRSQILWWLDDILIFSETIPDHLLAIQRFLAFCLNHNFRLHPEKCTLLATRIQWCGRLIGPDGIRFDPRRIAGIRDMASPQSGAGLQQLVCAMQWMRSAIPEFSKVISPLATFLEKVYTAAGKRTRLAVSKIRLQSLSWAEDQENAFRACKRALECQVRLAHVDYTKRLCVFTDASDLLWAGVITQVPVSDIPYAVSEQQHEPLPFFSGHFGRSKLRWSTLEKEAYAIMATVERMHWLLATGHGFDLYTDHNNLIFLFNPAAVVADLSQTTLRKVLRWAVRLSAYNYTCVHIPGSDNVWADIISRWSAPSLVRRLVTVPVLPSSSDSEFEWPSSEQLLSHQKRNVDSRPAEVTEGSDGLSHYPDGAIWIPSSSDDLQLRLCIIAHTGPSGHRALEPTKSALRDRFFWPTLSVDIDMFVKSCIHCLSTTGGRRVPRPFGPAVHGTRPNDLLQFDYLEIAPASNGDKYILMLRDDHSSYCWLFAFADMVAGNAARAIIDWCAALGVPNGLMSDGPTHFKNETVRLVAKGLRVPHHFTLPYTPWSNGGIERLGKEILRAFRAIASELRMRPEEWPDLLPFVQSVLNNTPSPHRGNICPIKAMTGLEPTPPIKTFYRSSTLACVSVPDIVQERAINSKRLLDIIAELHPIVHNALHEHRKRHRDNLAKGTLPNFTEGDFVLVAREEFASGEKLALRWRGPRRVVRSVNEYVYQVEDLRNGLTEDVHITRLKFYHDASLDCDAIMPHVLSSETGMEVQRLMRLFDSPSGLMVQVRWRGFPPTEDTSEPLQKIFEDVPALVLKFLNRKKNPSNLVARARQELSLRPLEEGV